MEQRDAPVTPTRDDLAPLDLPESQQVAAGGNNGTSTSTSTSPNAHPTILQPLDDWSGTSAGGRAAKPSASKPVSAQGDPRWRLWRVAAEDLERICMDPTTLGGIPVVRDTRISVAQVLDTFTDVESLAALLDEFPGKLELPDLHQVLIFAARLSRS